MIVLQSRHSSTGGLCAKINRNRYQTNCRLGETGQVGTEVCLDQRPPAAEIHLFVERLKQGYGGNFSVTRLLVGMLDLWWELWSQPGGQELQGFGDRQEAEIGTAHKHRPFCVSHADLSTPKRGVLLSIALGHADAELVPLRGIDPRVHWA